MGGSAVPSALAEDGAASTDKRVVRVAFYENGDYQYTKNEGTHGGFTVDYLNKVGRYADWTYNFVSYPNWESAFAAVQAGEADLLPLVYFSEERARQVRFSSSPLCDLYSTLNVRENDKRFAYEDFAAFTGMRVGVIAGSEDARSFTAYAAEHGFTPELVSYETTEALFDALNNGTLDAIAMTHLGSNSPFRIVAQFDPAPLFAIFPLDRADVAAEFDKATDELMLRDPDFATLLCDRYFGINTDQDPVFTADEYAYLASAPTLRVAYDAHRAPLAYTDPETGAFAGVGARLFEDISRITGLSFEFVPTEVHAEVMSLLAEGEVDIGCGVARDLDHESKGLITTTGPYLRDPLAVVVGANSDGNRVGVPQGFMSDDVAGNLRDTDEITRLDTPKACFDALLADEVDRVYVDTHVASYLMAEPQYSPLSMATLTNYANDLSLGVTASADPRLVRILDRCVQYTSESKMTTWLSESSLSVHPTSLMDILRQYPLEIILGLFLLFCCVSAVGYYLSRTKVRTARRIEELSFTDPLTGGWSLARFRSLVSEQLREAPDGRYALLYLDIKRFKSFNAAFGYTAGDELLKDLARTLHDLSREDEHFARITADEFAVLVRWDGWDDFITHFAELDRRFNELPVLTELSHRLSLQAGVCLVDRTHGVERIDAQTIMEFMDCARYARDSIGETSQSTAVLYNDGMKERDIAERALVAAAHDALAGGEFTAFYQPKVELATNRIVGFEALARWESPERGLVPPDEFIPLFEKTGLVKELDLQVFKQACARIHERLEAGAPMARIACNFSRLHLLDDGFPDHLKALVDSYGVPVELLELELTENIVMEDLDRAESVCRRLKDLGFRISIDDFGSGYSSLGTLQDLPIDVLKLDRTFLMSSESGERSKTILEGVVGIAERLHVTIVVEGVETCEQAAMLLQLDDGIIAQGFLYSRPVPRAASDQQMDAGVLEPGA